MSVGQRHKPDLVAIDSTTGQVRLWIDYGQIETDRLVLNSEQLLSQVARFRTCPVSRA